uniref:Ku70/Ku80 N-terminal alpha/beta domain-containing protein n=1 Tax=Hemiselmis andersenii TaxID=464988 RepID=A0A7S1DIH5_HEMAN|mmetsp:Transcript_13720/g.33627  ORF Transcript_13720/g.33627 Transcript_13720/m.33627 type:complete len:420 (+) Transcript_13720:62-1321(+)
MDRNDYDDDFEVDSDEDEGDDEEGGADIERPRNRPSLLCFLVDASKLMIDTHPFTKDERDDQKSYSIRSDVRSYYGLAMSALSNACREQVKKGLADQVGVILFNCDSGDAKDSQGVYCLREIKPLDCGFITMIDRHGKEGTYTQDSSLKAIDLKPSDGVCPQKDKGDTPSYQCHLLTALQEARDMFGKVAGKATEMRKTICVLTCSDDPLGGAVKSQVRLLRKKALLGKCHDIKDFNIHIDVYPLQHDVTLDGFPPDSDGPAPPATRDVFRAGIIFKQLLTLSEVPFDTEAGKEVANKCIQCNDDLECAGKKVLQRVEEMLCDRHVGQLQDDIEARILMMRSLGSMRWILEWGCEDMRIGLKVYSLTSTSRSYKSTMVTARLREKVQMVKEKLDAEGNILDNRETKKLQKGFEGTLRRK